MPRHLVTRWSCCIWRTATPRSSDLSQRILRSTYWSAARCPFAVLGVTKASSVADIRKAYFSLAKLCHPDINDREGAQKQFQEISDAYTLLTDEHERRAYEVSIGAKPRFKKGQQAEVSAKAQFRRVFEDLRFVDPDMAMEKEALYAMLEMKRGNEQPTRDFVIDYGLPPQMCLPQLCQLDEPGLVNSDYCTQHGTHRNTNCKRRRQMRHG